MLCAIMASHLKSPAGCGNFICLFFLFIIYIYFLLPEQAFAVLAPPPRCAPPPLPCPVPPTPQPHPALQLYALVHLAQHLAIQDGASEAVQAAQAGASPSRGVPCSAWHLCGASAFTRSDGWGALPRRCCLALGGCIQHRPSTGWPAPSPTPAAAAYAGHTALNLLFPWRFNELDKALQPLIADLPADQRAAAEEVGRTAAIGVISTRWAGAGYCATLVRAHSRRRQRLQRLALAAPPNSHLSSGLLRRSNPRIRCSPAPARSLCDGFDRYVPFTPAAAGSPPGEYQFTPGQTFVVYPQIAQTKPLVLSSVAEVRPGRGGGPLAGPGAASCKGSS